MARGAMALRRSVGEQVRHPRAERARCVASARSELVERRLRARIFLNQPVFEARREVENAIADRHADVRLPSGAKDAERKILERKVARVIRRFNPRFQSHPSSFRSATGSSNEQEPNEIANSLLIRARSSVPMECPRQAAASSPNSNARASVSTRIIAACCGSAAAMKTLTNPCIVPVGASGSYVSGLMQRIG